ncbi:hypothetical protein [Sneathiella chinensis]|uniref:hypothetical protein n=1 Tax=Sneathiella chinensis TaxID=349750 RepID=UPI00146C1E6F|nr:hypothetical protein [Sneathiella chinensis]
MAKSIFFRGLMLCSFSLVEVFVILWCSFGYLWSVGGLEEGSFIVVALFEWECFEGLINDGDYELHDDSILHAPVSDISIKRSDDFQIYVTTKSREAVRCNRVNYPLGTVRENQETTKIVSKFSSREIVLRGVGATSYTISSDFRQGGVFEETAYIHSVEGCFLSPENGCYLFEWVENIDASYFYWPRIITLSREETITVSFEDEVPEICLSEKKIGKGGSERRGVKLSIDGNELYVSKVSGERSGRAFIMYKGCPSDEVRNKIRDCISFCLGRPIIYLGNTILDKKLSLVSFSAISAYSFNGAAINLPICPPVCLGERDKTKISEIKLNLLVKGLYGIYDKHNVRGLFWQYWHAVCSPVHSAPVQFGSCIEALTNSILRINKRAVKTKILEEMDWKAFAKEADKMLLHLDICEEGKKVIRKKISSLNSAPQKLVNERVYEFLNLEFTEMEKVVWERRNAAAHGRGGEEKNHAALIRENKILRILFHRLLIKVSGGCDQYIDFYTINHPIRLIETGIPSDVVD